MLVSNNEVDKPDRMVLVLLALRSSSDVVVAAGCDNGIEAEMRVVGPVSAHASACCSHFQEFHYFISAAMAQF